MKVWLMCLHYEAGMYSRHADAALNSLTLLYIWTILGICKHRRAPRTVYGPWKIKRARMFCDFRMRKMLLQYFAYV